MNTRAYPRYAFVILGMHRSGTSALAGLLSRYGADVPKNQMRPTEDNPSGYFESTPIKVLNERILDSAGTSWDDWGEISDGWYSGPRAAALKLDAQAVLAEEFGTSPLFVLKDPRNSRLWPFWRDVLADMGVTPIPILMLRDPEEVALSLLRRDKLPLALGRLVWLRHQLDAEKFTRGTARVVLRYDELLTDRARFLAELEKVSGFLLPRRSDQTETEIGRFIDPHLRHFTQEDRTETQAGSDIFSEAYQLLQDVGAEGSSTDGLDAIGQRLRDLSGVIYGLGAPVREMARDLNRASARLEALQRTEHDLTMERDVLGELVTEKKALIEAAISARDQMAGERDRAFAERDAAQKAEQLQVAEKAALAETTAAATAAANAARDKATRDLAASAEAIRVLQTEIRSMQTEMGKWADIAAKREATLLQRSKDEVVQERNRILNDFYNSRSWKITAPVRWISRAGRRNSPS